jgi:membrane protein
MVVEPEKGQSLPGRLFARVLDLPPVRRQRAILGVFSLAGGSLLAQGLAYSALVAGLTGLLFAVALLGYVVPAEVDRQKLIDGLSGELAPFAPVARDGLKSVAEHAGAFSIVGLAGLAWGASQFYGALDEGIARVFARAPARNPFDRILRGFVSVLLLAGGLFSGIGISTVQAVVINHIGAGSGGDAGRILSLVFFPAVTALVIVVAVGVVYRIVPNTNVPMKVLYPPAIVAGLVLTGLAELLVYIAPLLAGALSVFGGVAVIFAALAWLHLAFEVLLVGASWTRLRLDDSIAADEARIMAAEPAEDPAREPAAAKP